MLFVFKVNGEFRMLMGPPGQVLCEVAEAEHAQLIVVGTRGYGTIRRTILGSVSDYVIHHAHCPAAVIREKAPV